MEPTTRDTATRIAAGDDRTRYDTVSIALHWATAGLVLAQFLTAQAWELVADSAAYAIFVAHLTMGVLLSAAVVARIAWRLMPGHRIAPATTGWSAIAARIVHWLLYLLLVAEMVLGWLARWTEGRPILFFGVPIDSPIAPWPRAAHHALVERHELLAWLIVVLAAGHALAALYHHYHLRDRVLVRMAPWLDARR